MATSTQLIGFVTQLTESVTAVSKDGVTRVLSLGDQVYADETIITGFLATVSIEFLDGSRLDLGRDSSAVLDNEVFDPAAYAAFDEDTAPIEAIQQAILAGEDPTEILAAAAAGAGGTAGDAGHGFVMLDLFGQQTTPTSGFPTKGPAVAFEEPPPDQLYVEDQPGIWAYPDGSTVEEGLVVDGNVLTNDQQEGSEMTVSTPGQYQGQYGQLNILADGSYSYIANDGLDHSAGPLLDSFPYAIVDENGTPAESFLMITVTDGGPLAQPDVATLSEGMSIVGNVLANDQHQGDTPILVSSTGQVQGEYGVLSLSANGDYSYIANAGLDHSAGSLVDIFTYNILDADGSPAVSTLTITVTDLGPLAQLDTASLEEGSSIGGNVLTNDVQGFDNSILVTTTGQFQGEYGVLSLMTNGDYTYIANDGLDHSAGPLTDAFAYGIVDADGSPSESTLTIMVTDGGPLAQPDTASLQEGSSVSGNLLVNDIDQGDSPVTVSTTGQILGTYGVLSLSANGSYTYIASDGLDHSGGNLVDTFDYGILDADGSPSSSTLMITVTDGGPLAVNDFNSVEAGASVSGNVMINDAHRGDAPITVTSTGTFTSNLGTLELNSNGSYIYTANPELEGPVVDSFTYSIVDADGSPASAVLAITIVTEYVPPSVSQPVTLEVDEALMNADNLPALVFTAGSHALTSFVFGSTTGMTVNTDSLAGADVIWVPVSGTEIHGLVDGDLAMTLTLSAPGSIAPLTSADVPVTAALSDNFFHPEAGGTNTVTITGLQVIATSSGGDEARGDVDVAILDDVPIAGNIQHLVMANEVSSLSGALDLDYGADEFGSISLNGTAPAGVTYTVTDTAGEGKMLTATWDNNGSTYFTLELNPDGSYTYDLQNPVAAVTETISFGSMPSGNFDQIFYVTGDADAERGNAQGNDPNDNWVGDKAGGSADDITLVPGPESNPYQLGDDEWILGITGDTSGDTINVSGAGGGGWGVNANQFESGQTMAFQWNQARGAINDVEITIVRWGGGSGSDPGGRGLLLYWEAFNAAGNLVDKGFNNQPDSGDDVLTLSASQDFYQLEITPYANTSDMVTDLGQSTVDALGVPDVDYNDGSQLIFGAMTYTVGTTYPEDANFQFEIGAADADGDVITPVMLNVHLEAEDEIPGLGLTGSSGEDVIQGAETDDILVGGGSDDILVGLEGEDQLTGGTGGDEFLFRHINDAGDVISDFNPGAGDTLNLAAVLPSYAPASSDNYIQLVANNDHTELYVNPDGTGVPGDTSSYTLMVTLLDFQTSQSVLDLIDDGTLIVDII